MKHCKRILAAALAALLALSVLAGCAGGAAGLDTDELTECILDIYRMDDYNSIVKDDINCAQKVAKTIQTYYQQNPDSKWTVPQLIDSLNRTVEDPVGSPYHDIAGLRPAFGIGYTEYGSVSYADTDYYDIVCVPVKNFTSSYYQGEQLSQLAHRLLNESGNEASGMLCWPKYDMENHQYVKYTKWAISAAVETYGSETYIFAVNHYYY